MRSGTNERRARIVRAVVGLGATVVMVGSLAGCGGGSSGTSKTTTAEQFANALSLQNAGQLDQAKVLYEQVLRTVPGNYFAHYNLGVIDQSQGKPSSALAEYGAALTARPNYVPAMFNEATIYQQTDPQLAISTYREVVALQQTAPTAYLNLGLLEVHHGQPKPGVHDLATAVTQDAALLPRVPKQIQKLVQALVAGGSATPSPTTSSS